MSKRAEDAPHPVDVIAGRNLRIARTRAGYTQERLGEAVGVSFQQIQKYERGRNRMSLSRAYEFAEILQINPADFFAGAQVGVPPSSATSPYLDRWLVLFVQACEAKVEAELARCAEDILVLAEAAMLPSRKEPEPHEPVP